MIAFIAVFGILSVLFRRFVLAYPRLVASLFMFGGIYATLDYIPVTQSLMNRAGLSDSLDLTARPLVVTWGTANTCGIMHCDESRFATIQITNHTGKFFNSFRLNCETPDGSSFTLYDNSGIMAHAQRETRSYKVNNEYSSVSSCQVVSQMVGKPNTNYYNENWGDRTQEVMLPTEVE